MTDWLARRLTAVNGGTVRSAAPTSQEHQVRRPGRIEHADVHLLDHCREVTADLAGEGLERPLQSPPALGQIAFAARITESGPHRCRPFTRHRSRKDSACAETLTARPCPATRLLTAVDRNASAVRAEGPSLPDRPSGARFQNGVLKPSPLGDGYCGGGYWAGRSSKRRFETERRSCQPGPVFKTAF